jgi:hypothetical protein
VTRARAALLVSAILVSFLLGTWMMPAALAAPPRHGTVIVFIVDRVSFEEAMAIAQFRAIATGGGAALVATSEDYRGNESSVFQALGSGTAPARGHVQLMGRVLRRYGIAVCVREGAGLAGYQPPAPQSPLRYLGLGANGDAACLAGSSAAADEVIFLNNHFISDFARPRDAKSPADLARLRRKALETEGEVIEGIVDGEPAGRLLLLVIAPSPSAHMRARGEEVTPLLMAGGNGRQIFGRAEAPRALRSDTTRLTGLVSNVDVAPTILDFFGIPIPSEMDGQPIRVTDEPAPFKLHRLHLEQRRIRFPIQLAELAFVVAAGAVAIAVLLFQARREYLPDRVAGGMRFLALCGVALPIPLMLGGLLPRLTYWVVVPFIVFSVVVLAALARATRFPGPVAPFTFLGVVGLMVVAVDAIFGWRGARIPLIGGTMFDGARFYGLPNAFLCVVLAGALFVAAALPAFPGFLVLVGAGLFAGFPSLGADVGGAMTLFFAAGLWWVIRTRRRFGLKELAFVAGVTALGLGAVLLANRYLPGTPTHATRFVGRAGNNLTDAFRELGDRLTVGFRQIRDAPPALIPLLGLPVVLWLVLVRPAPIGAGTALTGERWRQALVVLTLSGIVAFFVNDTGVAAAAPLFLYAMSGMAYPAFLVATRRGGVNGRSDAWTNEERDE